MSLSKPKDVLTRPAQKYIQFSGDTGKFSYYHKFSQDDPEYSESNKGERREIEIKDAIVLDADLFSVTGYDTDRGYCYTNEVRSVEDELVLRFFQEKRVAAKGAYKEIKEEFGKAIRYTKCVYLWLNGEICHLQIFGKSLGSWFNDIESNPRKLTSNVVNVKEIQTADKGKRSEHKLAIFAFGREFTDKERAEAIAQDEIVQEYLEKYLSKNGTSTEKGNTSPVEHEEHEHSSEEKTYDTSDWRDFNSDDLGVLGEQPTPSIYNHKVYLEDSGRTDTEEYSMVCAALHEYEKARKDWKSMKDNNKKLLSEYTFEEVKETLKKVMKSKPDAPARLYLEAAYEELESQDEDDEIPF